MTKSVDINLDRLQVRFLSKIKMTATKPEVLVSLTFLHYIPKY